MAVYDPITPDEVWYPIPGLPGYELSSDLRVRSFHKRGWDGGNYGGIGKTWKLISVRVSPRGYPRFYGKRDHQTVTVYIHQVVARLAYGEPPEGMSVLHHDDDRLNCCASNLKFGTSKENTADSLRNGTFVLGSKNGNAKLTEGNVSEIRHRLACGETRRALAVEFGVTPGLLSMIRLRRIWCHVV